MKVLELVLKWAGGGIGKYVSNLTSAARNDGIDCHIAAVNQGVAAIPGDAYGPLVDGGVKEVLFKGADIAAFIADGDYDVVHVHGNNGLVYYFAYLAHSAGAKVIVHSHNSSFGENMKLFKGLFTDCERLLHKNECDLRFACSHAAGNFLFGKSQYQIALNGIDAQRFAYNAALRAELRVQLDIPEDAPVVGFAANLIAAKNPLFALKTFNELLALQSEARFLVCGYGDLLDDFKREASDLIDSGRCICVGHVADIERYYSAMDLLLAPSRFEGLPINLIEAQANGLSILMSDSITDEVVVVPELCSRLPLDAGSASWAQRLNALLNAGKNRADAFSLKISKAGYSQPECFGVVLDAYRNLVAGEVCE